MLILIDKPAVAHLLHARLSKRYPDCEIVYIVCNSFGNPLHYHYPRKLSWSDYPALTQPEYRFASLELNSLSMFEGGLVPARMRVTDLPRGVCAAAVAEPMASSVYSKELLRLCLVAAGVIGQWEGFHLLSDFSGTADLAPGLPGTDRTVSSLISEGRMRATFDFNFLINSAGLLTKVYRNCGGEYPDPVFSKYTVQSLYHFKHLQEGSSTNRVQVEDFLRSISMNSWKGTGKYAPGAASLGSSYSHEIFLKNLASYGLIRRWQDDTLELTALGDWFLNSLHPDCEDPDLPFRLSQWAADPDSGDKKASRYLMTWFGKQKRFMAVK